MDSDLLKVAPSNLPVYAYDLLAEVAFVHNEGVFKLKTYSFDSIRVVVNQPLRKGDSLDFNAYYPGNENVEILPHLVKKSVLGGLEKELRYYKGCIIGDLVIRLGGEEDYETCGRGSCTVFVSLTASALNDKWRELDNFEMLTDINEEHRAQWERLSNEYQKSWQSIDWWKSKLSDWDKCVTFMGMPEDFLLHG